MPSSRTTPTPPEAQPFVRPARPDLLAMDARLSVAERRRRLREWELDITRQQAASEEGMDGVPPSVTLSDVARARAHLETLEGQEGNGSASRPVALSRIPLDEPAPASGASAGRDASVRGAPWRLGLAGLGGLAVLILAASLLATPALLFLALPVLAIAAIALAWPVYRRRRRRPGAPR